MANVYKRLEVALIEAVKEFREEFCSLNDPPTYIDFNITVDGRTMDGDLEIKFVFNSGSYSNTTKGGSLINVIEEFKRRHGWIKRNDPICLPRVDPEEEPKDDDIPF